MSSRKLSYPGYPWDHIPNEYLTYLMSEDPTEPTYRPDQLINRRGKLVEDPNKTIDTINIRERDEGAAHTFYDKEGYSYDANGLTLDLDLNSTIARWLHSGRRLVEISEASANLLVESEPRISALPPLLDRKPWKLGYMFRYKMPAVVHDEIPGRPSIGGRAIITGSPYGEMPIVFYVEPSQEALGLGVRLSAWVMDSDETGLGWHALIYREHDENGGRIQRGCEVVDCLTENHRSSIGRLACGTRVPLDRIRRLAVNAFACLHAIPETTIVRNPSRKRTTVSGVSKVKRLTLNEQGTSLALRRWEREQAEAVESPARTVGQHHVDQHHWRVWVNSPLAHEVVLDTRTKIRGDEEITQYRVKRLRGPVDGFVRGSGPMKANHLKLVTGIDDL